MNGIILLIYGNFKINFSWAPVAHTSNPSYSGELGYKASLGQIVGETLSQKNPSYKRPGGVAQVVR
jgi:hypothetical protein